MSNPLDGTGIGENNIYKIYDYTQGGIINRLLWLTKDLDSNLVSAIYLEILSLAY